MRLTPIREWLLDIVFPKSCIGCGLDGELLCPECREKLRFGHLACPVCNTRNFDGIVCGTCSEEVGLRRFLAPYSYRDPLVRDVIHTYKYEGVRELAPILAEGIVDFLYFYGVKPPSRALLVPIPLHRSRLGERGFNQSELLARALGSRIGLETALALRRTKRTEQQIDMDSHDARHTNVRNAFSIADPGAVAGRTCILVDDISTSGATLSEAAKVLRNNGARTVWAITVAKG